MTATLVALVVYFTVPALLVLGLFAFVEWRHNRRERQPLDEVAERRAMRRATG